MKRFLLIFAVACVCSAAPIAHSGVYCGLTRDAWDDWEILGYDSGATSCQVAGYGGLAQGDALASAEIKDGILRVVLKGSGYVENGYELTFDEDGNVVRNNRVVASVNAWSTVLPTLYTVGPKRRGFAEVEFTLNSLTFNSSFQIFTPKINDAAGYECVYDWGCRSTRLAMEEVDLGGGSQVPFQFYLHASHYGWPGSADVDVTVRFYESDGQTLVAVSDVPEPGSWMLAGLGLTSFLAAGSVSRTKQ